MIRCVLEPGGKKLNLVHVYNRMKSIKYEICAILHLYISCDCDSHIKLLLYHLHIHVISILLTETLWEAIADCSCLYMCRSLSTIMLSLTLTLGYIHAD